MAKLFVAYYYTRGGRNGHANHVLDDTAAPTDAKEVAAIQQRVQRAAGVEAAVILNWIAMP